MLKLIKYDFKLGYNSIYKKLLVFVIIVIFFNIVGTRTISMMAGESAASADVLDYICFILGGPRYIPIQMLQSYQIPIMWLAIQVMIAYTIGYYAVTDLNKYGQQVLLRSTSRIRWWISKIVWNAVTVVLMYGIVLVITIINAYISGAKFDWELTEEVAIQACNLDMIPQNNNEVLIVLLLMPVIVSITLSVMQIGIALISSPIIGFLVSQSITFLSTIYATKWLISNYAILPHNKCAAPTNIVYGEGIIICAVVYIVTLVAEIIYFSNCNILPAREI